MAADVPLWKTAVLASCLAFTGLALWQPPPAEPDLGGRPLLVGEDAAPELFAPVTRTRAS